MNPPLTPLPSDIQTLVEEAPKVHAMPDPLRDQIWRRLATGVVAGGRVARAGARFGSLPAGLLGLGFGVIAGVWGTLVWQADHIPPVASVVPGRSSLGAVVPPPPPVAPVLAPPAVPAAPKPPAAVEGPSIDHPKPPQQPATAPVSPPQASVARFAAEPPAKPLALSRPPGEIDADLAEERTLLDMARTALMRSDADRALAALSQSANLYPNGRLSEEREALRVESLLAAGRRPEAEKTLANFARSHPDSLLLPAMKAVLERSP